MTEPVFDGCSIREHAGQVADSVRAINHLSLGRVGDEALPYPSDVAVVVGDLARAAYGLRRAAAQLAARIDRLDKAGLTRDADPDPNHPDPAARACLLLTGPVATTTHRLAVALGAAQSDLSRLAYEKHSSRPPRTTTPDASTPVVEATKWPGLGR